MGGHAIVSGGHAGPPLQDSRDEKKIKWRREEWTAKPSILPSSSSLQLGGLLGRTVGADLRVRPLRPVKFNFYSNYQLRVGRFSPSHIRKSMIFCMPPTC